MQSAAGWDWVAPVSDRNTGLWDRVSLGLTFGEHSPSTTESDITRPDVKTGSYPCAAPRMILTNPAVFTEELLRDSNSSTDQPGSSGARLRAVVSVLNLANAAYACELEVQVSIRHESSELERDEAQPIITESSKIYSVPPIRAALGTETELSLDLFLAPKDLTLWWPHTFLGDDSDTTGPGLTRRPHLYTAIFSLRNPSAATLVYHSTSLAFGVRAVDSFYDETIQARAFTVNGKPLYIEGGNWITTDAMLRFATDRERYREEVALHVAMGLNLIRVWGGGITETRGFYDACDRAGIFVYQEFWMTGTLLVVYFLLCNFLMTPRD